MNIFRAIRQRLGVTQAVLADALGMTQGNVSFCEQGQTVLPETAAKLIEYAKGRGLELSYDMVYGAAPLPTEAPVPNTSAVAHVPAERQA